MRLANANWSFMIRLAAIILLAVVPSSASANPSPSDLRAFDRATTNLERGLKAAEACGNHCSRTVALRAYNALHAYGIVASGVAAHQGCRATYPAQKGRAAETAMHTWALNLSRANDVRAVLAYRRYATAIGVQITTCWQGASDPGGNLLPQ